MCSGFRLVYNSFVDGRDLMSIDDAIDFQNFSTYLYLKDKKLFAMVQLLACGYSQSDISKENGISDQAVSIYMKKLKNLYKHFEKKTIINYR
jgi:predicted DNA-binding protein YlxM (UPF0122 family)